MIRIFHPAAYPFTVVVLFALFASACTSVKTIEGIDSLDAARAKWEQTGPQEYTYRFNWSCFCPREWVAETDVHVRDGKVISATRVEDGEKLVGEDLERYKTIDELFALIAEAREQDADKIDVEYDTELGFPTKAWIDYEERAADEERGFSASMLRTSGGH